MKHFSTPLRALGCLVITALGCQDPPQERAVRVGLDPYAVPPPLARDSSEQVEVDLTAMEQVAELAQGQRAVVWTFNGTVPGPMIRVRLGDQVVLRLHNALSSVEPHSIDLHAVLGPGGGHAVTEVKPGQTKELRFRASVAGTFIYHCAAENMAWEHVAHGMYGAIVVEPAGGFAPVDREIYVAQSEWYLRDPSAAAQEADDEDGESDEAGAATPTQRAPHVAVLDEHAARLEQPSFFTFNGHREALADDELYGARVQLAAGERLRIFFANAGPNLSSAFHVVGAVFEAVRQNDPEQALEAAETVEVPPGSAAAFELSFPVPGHYTMLDHALLHAQRGALGRVQVSPRGELDPDLFSPAAPTQH